MADRFYGVVIGGQLPGDVSEAGSTTSRAFEFRINDTAYASTTAALAALEAIKNYLQTKETRLIA